MNLRDLKADLAAQKRRTGLVGVRLDVARVPGDSIRASISHDWRTMRIHLGEDLDLLPDDPSKRYARKLSIDDAVLSVATSMMTHEAGHRENPVGTRRGCPHTITMHDAIKETIHKVLEKKGYAQQLNYVTNAFEDVIDNINCRHIDDFAGQTLFWNNQGLIKASEGYSPFYEAFVRINLTLGGRAADATLLRRFYTDTDEVSGAVRAYTQDMARMLGERSVLRLHEKDGFEHLFTSDGRERLWCDLARSFAEATADLLKDTPSEELLVSTNPFDEELNKPAKRQEIAYARYKQGKGPATHRDAHEQLHDLYKRISKEIRIETGTYTAAHTMPLVHFGRRYAGEDERRLRFRGIGVREDGSLGVRTTKHHLDHPISYKTHPRRFPKLKVALMDRSSSMGWAPDVSDGIGDTSFIPWGDNSRYHYALKGYFGIENFLERQGIAPYVENTVLGFSGERAVRGDARSVARSLLTSPRGGTSLDVDGLERELTEDALILSISDGDCNADAEQRQRFEKAIAGKDFAHIQIGPQTQFTSYLHKLGVPVFCVRGDDDLARIMVTFVSDYYRSQGGGPHG